jgi:hypothetical protein
MWSEKRVADADGSTCSELRGNFSTKQELERRDIDLSLAPRYLVAVLQRVQKLIVVSLLITAVGAQWGILQSAAWVGMFIRYSQTENMENAWTKTFDGQHPCKLCKLLKEAKKTESKSETLKVEDKLEGTFFPGAALLHPPRPRQEFAAVTENAPGRIDAPPTPPPRLV